MIQSTFFKRILLGARPRRTLLRCGLLLLICVLLFGYVLAILRLDGQSMEPTYRHGAIALANRLAYFRQGPERGDVVAVRLRESGRGIFYLKRVVGLPGEQVGFRDGQLWVDGRPVSEPYLVYPSDWDMDPVLCSPDEYFLVGDNRSMPIRDHTFGRARGSLILGKVIF